MWFNTNAVHKFSVMLNTHSPCITDLNRTSLALRYKSMVWHYNWILNFYELHALLQVRKL